jgi:hypothetical protein
VVVWRKIPLQNETITFKHDLILAITGTEPDPVSAANAEEAYKDQAMRTHKLNKSRKLYRSDNTTTRHYSINPGSIAGGETVKKPKTSCWQSARQCMAGKREAVTIPHCFTFSSNRLANRGIRYSAKYVVVLIQQSLFSGWSRCMSIRKEIWYVSVTAAFIRACLLMEMESYNR